MLAHNLLNAELSLKAGKYTHLPNTVFIPRDRKTFPVTVQWATEASDTFVVGASHREARRAWCLLDDNLQQLMAESGAKKPAKTKALSNVARMLHGGGAHNPKDVTVELDSSKLKNGHTYTLVCKLYGVLAATEFVAIADPKGGKKAKRKTKRKKKASKRAASKKKSAKKKSAKKKSAKKKSAKKKSGKKKPAKRKTARKKPAKRKSAKRKPAKKKPAKRKAAKRKTAKRKTSKRKSSRKKK